MNKGEKERNAVASLSVSQSSEKNKLAPLHSDAIQIPPLRLWSYLLLYVVLLSLSTHIMSTLIT